MKIAYKNVYIYLQNYIKGTSCKTVEILIIIKPKQQQKDISLQTMANIIAL